MSSRPREVTDAALGERIAAGARLLEIELQPRQVDSFVAYLRLLERWNATYNLTAVRDPEEMVPQHLLDCLAAAAALVRRRSPAARRRLLDVGSGAGLPGLVLAVVLPESEVVCVDSVGKKTAFIAQAAAVLRARNAVALHARVETLRSGSYDVITSRALASLRDFVASTRHLLADNGEWMALKGRVSDQELAGLRDVQATVETVVVPGLNAARSLVWIRPARP